MPFMLFTPLYRSHDLPAPPLHIALQEDLLQSIHKAKRGVQIVESEAMTGYSFIVWRPL